MRNGFSLVELSIVLVILGLLTGGILAGQSLIRASELRSVTADYQRYLTAAHTFRDKYLAAPGDITSATRFWNRMNANADCVTNSATAVGTPGTCDGNGNGLFNNAAVAGQSSESFQFWRQLALAGLIEGTYTGLSGTGGVADAIPGENAPTSKITNAGWTFKTPGGTGSVAEYKMDYGPTFMFGIKTIGAETDSRVFRPEEAWGIDVKMDDGKPAYGNVILRFWNTCSTSIANDNYTGEYKLLETQIQCALYFRKAL